MAKHHEAHPEYADLGVFAGYGEGDESDARFQHVREIFRQGGPYVMCQILNWRDGPPPKYLVCNPLTGRGAGQLILAHQGMGTWMEADMYEVARKLNEC